MTKKRVKKPVRRKKRRRSKRPATRQMAKAVGLLSILVLLVVGAGLLMRHIIQPPTDGVPPDRTQPPRYEVFPKQAMAPKPIRKLKQPPGDRVPKVAIILDDIGYDLVAAQQFMALDTHLTYSVLPHGPYSRSLAAQARAQGHEIMLHLPMEPTEFPAIDPGPGALLSRMSPDELISTLQLNLDMIPGLSGVNNHMGSNMSTSPEQMRQIFSILKKHDLYYIDSRTTSQTVARSSAALLRLRFAERDIFIDHHEEEPFIRVQLDKLIKRAQRQGYALGIAHPHAITYRVLADYLPRLKEAVELVPASKVVAAYMQARLD